MDNSTRLDRDTHTHITNDCSVIMINCYFPAVDNRRQQPLVTFSFFRAASHTHAVKATKNKMRKRDTEKNSKKIHLPAADWSCKTPVVHTTKWRSTDRIHWEETRKQRDKTFDTIEKETYALVDEIAGQVFERFECQLRGIGRDEIAHQSNLKHESHLTVAILHDWVGDRRLRP